MSSMLLKRIESDLRDAVTQQGDVIEARLLSGSYLSDPESGLSPRARRHDDQIMVLLKTALGTVRRIIKEEERGP